MFVGLEHTAIASPSPRTLAQWYVDHLDFKINFEYDGNFFVRAANGAMLEIIPSEGDGGSPKMRTPGLRHLAIEVTDFDAAHTALRAKGVNFAGDAFVNQGNRLVFFSRLRRQPGAPDPEREASPLTWARKQPRQPQVAEW
jgi:glyoxylase I family protein